MNYRNVILDPSVRIAHNATVNGDVTIGKDCTILFNATLRGDDSPIIIGDRSNIQENSCVHVGMDSPCIIGEGVTVGHNAVVHGCTIGDGSLVGMGATVMDHAVIGKNCLIGAGALVTGGTEIPDGMLVIGSPAKAKRPLTEAELDSLIEATEEYVHVGAEMVEQDILYTGANLPEDCRNIAVKRS